MFLDADGWTIALDDGATRGVAVRMRVRDANAATLVPGARHDSTSNYFSWKASNVRVRGRSRVAARADA